MPSTRPFVSFLFNLSSLSSSSTTNQPKRPAIKQQQKQQSQQPGQTNVHSASSSINNHQGLFKQNSHAGPIPVPGPSESPDNDFLLPTMSSSPRSSSPYGYSERRNSNTSLSQADYSKWWIGGRSSDGSERYYRLNTQPLQRHKSVDRISLDRLSI